MSMTEAQRRAFIARIKAERVAAGLPELIEDEGFYRLLGHVLATHAAKPDRDDA